MGEHLEPLVYALDQSLNGTRLRRHEVVACLKSKSPCALLNDGDELHIGLSTILTFTSRKVTPLGRLTDAEKAEQDVGIDANDSKSELM